ncbi:hypothetical protein QUF80_09605 [Desulfococcaceae bacterium HSG8]|nr:hypothetical protein [Desulfococcaceae bacterium HSG8]
MNGLNSVNLRKIVYFLFRHEGEWYYPSQLKQAMSLDIDEEKLWRELKLLHRYDLIEDSGGRYGQIRRPLCPSRSARIGKSEPCRDLPIHWEQGGFMLRCERQVMKVHGQRSAKLSVCHSLSAPFQK